MKRWIKIILFFVNLTQAMQLKVTEEDLCVRSRSDTNNNIINITRDIVPLSHIKMSDIEDKFINNLDLLKESESLHVKDIVKKFRNIARLYATHDNCEAKNIILEDSEMYAYINSIVVVSMDQYIKDKDESIEHLQKQSRYDRIQKYLALIGSGCLTIVSIVIPIVIAALQCS